MAGTAGTLHNENRTPAARGRRGREQHTRPGDRHTPRNNTRTPNRPDLLRPPHWPAARTTRHFEHFQRSSYRSKVCHECAFPRQCLLSPSARPFRVHRTRRRKQSEHRRRCLGHSPDLGCSRSHCGHIKTIRRLEIGPLARVLVSALIVQHVAHRAAVDDVGRRRMRLDRPGLGQTGPRNDAMPNRASRQTPKDRKVSARHRRQAKHRRTRQRSRQPARRDQRQHDNQIAWNSQ